jgi:hypothetical protein
VRIIDNTFLQCTVALSYFNGVFHGNGVPGARISAHSAV